MYYLLNRQEGWILAMNIGGENDGKETIQKVDDDDRFDDDEQALAFVIGKAFIDDSKRHLDALKIISDYEHGVSTVIRTAKNYGLHLIHDYENGYAVVEGEYKTYFYKSWIPSN